MTERQSFDKDSIAESLRVFAGRQAFDEERELVYGAAERIEYLERQLDEALFTAAKLAAVPDSGSSELSATRAELQRSFAREQAAQDELRRREQRKNAAGYERHHSAQTAWDFLRNELKVAQSARSTTGHWVFDAAERHRPIVEGLIGCELDRKHMIHMLDSIKKRTFSPTKACRWLGWIQGVLNEKHALTLDMAKAINKRASEGFVSARQERQS